MNLQPLLSIVVCTHNRSNLLSDCLQSLSLQCLSKELYEVVIVDNNSTDATEVVALEYCELNPNFRLLHETADGLSHARNCGWKNARGTYVAFIDDDAKAAFDWCQKIVEAFRDVTPTPHVVGGSIEAWYEATPPSWFKNEYESFSWGETPAFLQPPQARFGFCGSNMTFRKMLLEEYGGFSSEYGMKNNAMGLGEETVLFDRMSKQNLLLWYDPAIIVRHWVPGWKLRVTYRIKRAFLSGCTVGSMTDAEIGKLEYLKVVSLFAYKVLRSLPIFLFITGKNKTTAVEKAQEVASEFGYLIAQRRFSQAK